MSATARENLVKLDIYINQKNVLLNLKSSKPFYLYKISFGSDLLSPTTLYCMLGCMVQVQRKHLGKYVYSPLREKNPNERIDPNRAFLQILFCAETGA